MGQYQSSPSNIITNQNFDLLITMLSEYFAYDNYYIIIDSNNFSNYSGPVNNQDGTSTITFTNLFVNGVGTYSFYFHGYTGQNDATILEGTLNINPLCYMKGTKILCKIDEIEQYMNIEELKPKTLIKTYLHGYKELKILAYNKFKNTANPKAKKIYKLYKLSKEKNSELIEDLYISGQHSILVDKLDKQQIDMTKQQWKILQKIDDKFLLMAWVSNDFEEINDDNEYELFQIILLDDNEKKQFGIWANGILSESMSYHTFIKKGRLENYHNKKNDI